MVKRILFLLLFFLSVSSFPTLAMPEEQLLYNTLEAWDKNSKNDQKNLIEVLKLYDIDTGFMTSRKPKDDVIKEELLQIMRSYKYGNYRDTGRLKKFTDNDEIYAKFANLFNDVKSILEKHPTLSVAERGNLKKKQAVEAFKEKKRQEELARQKEEEDLNKVAEEEAKETQEIYEKMSKKAKQLGYSLGVCKGIYDTIVNISDGTQSFESAKKCLISPGGYDIFRVQSLAGNFIIYMHERRGQQFALIKEQGKFYGDSSLLENGFFKIIDTQRFTTILGSEKELLVFKRVNFEY
ncbi:MAG: cell envelope integrity protein TolA [Nitrospinae bacterium]|nr:cell envelope integrity protein TolA [Nitrospinota bacterium]